MRTLMAALIGALAIVASPAGWAQGKPAAKPAAAAPKGPSADEKAMERAVANYKKNQAAKGGAKAKK